MHCLFRDAFSRVAKTVLGLLERWLARCKPSLKQSHSLERATTARLAKTVRNIQVEYSGRSRHVAQCCVAPHGIAWADASLGFKRSICASCNVRRESPKRAAKKTNYLYKILFLHQCFYILTRLMLFVSSHAPKARSFHSALLERTCHLRE